MRPLSVVVALLATLWSPVAAQNYVFGPNVRVNDDPPGSSFHSTYSPGQHCIAARGDTVYVVWRDDRDWSHIYFARSNDAGLSFLPNVRVDNTISGCAGIMPSLAVDDSGGIHVSWLNYNLRNTRFVYYGRSTDGGRSFLPAIRAADSVCRDQYGFSSIAVSRSGRCVFVARDQGRDSTTSIAWVFLSRSTDGGATFVSPDIKVCGDSTMAWFLHPSIAVLGESIVVVACDSHTMPSSRKQVLLARSTDGGATFSAPVRLSDSVGGDPSVATDHSRSFFVAWASGRGGAVVSVSRDSGRAFSQERLVPYSGGAGYVSLWANRGALLCLAWQLWEGGSHGVRFSSSLDEGMTFTPPVNPSDGPSRSDECVPTAAANEDGMAFVTWEDYRNNIPGLTPDIYLATGAMSSIAESRQNLPISLPCRILTNPARGVAEFEYQLTQQTGVRLTIRNLVGQVQKVLDARPAQLGQHRVHWDGRDARGRAVPSGVYFLQIQTPDRHLNLRFVYLSE